MPFTLYAPGTRKNNPYWLALLKVNGRRVEISTKELTHAKAKRFAQEKEKAFLAEAPRGAGAKARFAEAAEAYAAFRGLDLGNPRAHSGRQRLDANGILRLIAAIGRAWAHEITHADLIACANRLYPAGAAATKNREVLRPAAAILHYAAGNGLCAWLRVPLFREPKPRTRSVSLDVASALVATAPEGPKRLLLTWLFRQGTRISETLAVRWDEPPASWKGELFAQIVLPRQLVRLYVRKNNSWREFPLRADLFEMLAAIPEADRRGRLFPWRQKTGVYKWLRPLAKGLGIAFTPHMARHSLGTWLNESGAGMTTIMAALGHADIKSSARYQSADVEIVRAASARLGDFRPPGAPL